MFVIVFITLPNSNFTPKFQDTKKNQLHVPFLVRGLLDSQAEYFDLILLYPN